MARRRMFSLDVVDTDRFLEMSASAQALYFHLGMRADDDGFVASPKRITALCGCSIDDLNLLALKGFVKPFESGVLVIVDWKKNNLIRPDRYAPTQFQEEKAQLGMSDGIPVVNHVEYQSSYQRVPQVSIGKDSIGKDRLDKKERRTAAPPPTRFKPPTEDEVIEYFASNSYAQQEAKKYFDYYTANGWKVGGRASMKDWKAAARNWMRNAKAYSHQVGKATQETATDTIGRVTERMVQGDFSMLEGY